MNITVNFDTKHGMNTQKLLDRVKLSALKTQAANIQWLDDVYKVIYTEFQNQNLSCWLDLKEDK